MLTDAEKRILFDLAEALDRFVLQPDHCPDDKSEFARAIRQAQAIVALRVARREDPETWRLVDNGQG